jgi:hypothetical protein
MNAKFNLWTLLFGASAAWNIYTATQSKATVATVEPSTATTTLNASSTCPVDSVPYSKGVSATSLYTTKGFAIGSNTDIAINPDVNQFILPKCELAEMLSFTGPKDSIVAQLAINTARAGGRDTIDLYFKVINSQNQVRYYDFTQPCPPMCPKNE